MARTKTSGIYTDANGDKVADKWLEGERIYKRLGSVTHEQAEQWVAAEIQRRALAKTRGSRPRVTFREAAAKYLKDNRDRIASIEDAAWHVALLEPWISGGGLEEVHGGAPARSRMRISARGSRSRS